MPNSPSRRLVSPAVERLPAYLPGRSIDQVKREFGLTEAIKLASNENPFGPSPRAVEAMARALRDTHRYPDVAASPLGEELTARHGVRPGQLIFGAGVTDLVELAIRTFCCPGDHALISAGSFVAYRLFLKAAAVPFDEVPLAGDAIDLAGMAAAVRPETKLIFLPNPNNPTGSRFGAAELADFLARIPPDVLVFLDDAYIDFHDAPDVPDTLAAMHARPWTLVARGFSKAYGLAGMRLGYVLAAEELIEAMARVHRPFSATSVALEGGRAALSDKEHLEATLAGVREGRAFLTGALAELGIHALPSYANFVTMALGSRAEANAFAERLLRQGVIVRPLASFGMPSHVRATVGTRRENEAFLATVRATGR